jgi:DNA-binding HxlR family transcriptional regulator
MCQTVGPTAPNASYVNSILPDAGSATVTAFGMMSPAVKFKLLVSGAPGVPSGRTDKNPSPVGPATVTFRTTADAPVGTTTADVPDGRSGCPINLTMELLGDRWSLVVLRDIMFGGRTRFRDILDNSLEGTASNVLASRLAKLTHAGLLTRNAVEGHRQKIDYFLTEAAIELVPIIIEVGDWGSRWLPTTRELAVRARLLADGGPDVRDRFMAELRAVHLDQAPRPDDGVLAELDAAFQRAAASTD